MDILKKIFPYSFKVKDDIKALISNIVVYAAIGFVAGVVIGILAGVPGVKLLAGLVGGLVELYTTAGIVISFLDYFKVIK